MTENSVLTVTKFHRRHPTCASVTETVLFPFGRKRNLVSEIELPKVETLYFTDEKNETQRLIVIQRLIWAQAVELIVPFKVIHDSYIF